MRVPEGGSSSVPAGALDGLTIMRYAHIYRDRVSGGVEQYLRRLNHGLLEKHRLTLLQMYLEREAREGSDNTADVENVGLGSIVWVPVSVRHFNSRLTGLPERTRYVLSRMVKLHRREGGGEYGAIFSSLWSLLQQNGSHLRYSTTVLSDNLPPLLARRRVDLLVLHWMSYDAGILISRALETRVPFVYVNHFDNARLSLPLVRKWIAGARAVGTVSDQGIPLDLQNRCVNLSDAVDTDFFTLERAQPMVFPERPIILLVGRIHPDKGHRDLMEAARILAFKKMDFSVCLAGAVDSKELHEELRASAAAMGLGSRIRFLGERSVEEIRDWYAQSTVVALPSHSEGLPRVLLEGQAMKRPVVAYDSGGICEAVVPNKTGFLVKAGDVNALAERIGFLLDNEAARSRMGEHGREFVISNFSVSALIQRHEMFYLNALAGVGPGTYASGPAKLAAMSS